MYKIIDRNRNMYNLSILALVLYIVLVLTGIIGRWFIKDLDNIICFNTIIGYITMFVLWFSYIAVYVLWTPDSEGAKRKRPTWQFVLLLATIIVSSAISNTISFMIRDIGFSDFWTAQFAIGMVQYKILAMIGDIIHYTLLPVILAMIIILLVKCERKAKKILIADIVSIVLGIVAGIMQNFVYSIDDLMLHNKWAWIMSDINFLVGLAINILILAFTIIYTKQKYYR